MTPEQQRIAELEGEVRQLRAQLDAGQQDQARRRARARYQASRLAAKNRGEWQPYVPAGPVREHVQKVMRATGMSRPQFAAAAGIDEGTLSKILYEKGKAKVRPAIAAKARSVTAATVPIPDHGWVSPVGSTRRLQALAWLGWPEPALAERLEMHPATVRKVRNGDRGQIAAATARAIRLLYDQLWNVPPPESTRAEKIAVTKTRDHARKQGWAPAGAWDDDEIDDPKARPRGVRRDGEAA